MSRKIELSKITFFISSTYNDLKSYRERVIASIEAEKGKINAQEFFGARPNNSLETCIEEVKLSDVFILILAHRYGSVEQDSGKSYTELEYETALNEKKVVLAYVIQDDFPWNPIYIDKTENYKKQKSFIEKVQNDFTVDFFTTEEDLAMKVVRDLYRELPKNNFKIGQHTAEQNRDNTLKVIEKFILMPKLYSGQKVDLECKLGKPESVNINECKALNLSYGASIKRKIFPTDEEVNDIINYHVDYVYGNYESADTLINLDEDVPHMIQMKGRFGHFRKEIKKEKVYDMDEFTGNDPFIYSTVTSLRTGPRKKIVTEESYESIYIKGFIFENLIIKNGIES